MIVTLTASETLSHSLPSSFQLFLYYAVSGGGGSTPPRHLHPQALFYLHLLLQGMLLLDILNHPLQLPRPRNLSSEAGLRSTTSQKLLLGLWGTKKKGTAAIKIMRLPRRPTSGIISWRPYLLYSCFSRGHGFAYCFFSPFCERATKTSVCTSLGTPPIISWERCPEGVACQRARFSASASWWRRSRSWASQNAIW